MRGIAGSRNSEVILPTSFLTVWNVTAGGVCTDMQNGAKLRIGFYTGKAEQGRTV